MLRDWGHEGGFEFELDLWQAFAHSVSTINLLGCVRFSVVPWFGDVLGMGMGSQRMGGHGGSVQWCRVQSAEDRRGPV